MKNIDKIYKAIELETNPEVKKLLKEFILDNMPNPSKSKIQLKEFLSKDKELRPALCCICMDNEAKVAVATNGHIMFVSKELYVDKGRHEAKTLCDEYGEVIEDQLRYPVWSGVLPKNTIPLRIKDGLEELIKVAEADAKTNGVKKVNEKVNIRVSEDRWVRLGYAKLMLRAGLDGWVISKNEHEKALIKEWDGNTMLIMPWMPSDDDDTEKDYIFPNNQNRKE